MRNILNHEPDLVARMRRMKPKEGVNVVHSFARRGKRLRLAAVVNKKGQIVDWAATRKSET